MVVYVVTCEQCYANEYSVVGVYANRESAEYIATLGPDRVVEEYVVEEVK